MADDLATIARGLIDAGRFMTLATADADGRPWATPVFYATADRVEFWWLSSPETTHSGNVAVRPEVSIAIFDSHGPAGTSQGVFMAATALEAGGEELERGLAVYPGAPERGGRPVAREQVSGGGRYRLYRARVTEHFVVCPRDRGPCAEHGKAYAHRVRVELH